MLPSPDIVAAERPVYLVQTPEVHAIEPRLRALQAAVVDLSRPLALERIGAVVSDAAIDALDAQAIVVALHENDGPGFRGVSAAGLPDDLRLQICASSTTAAHLLAAIDGFLRGAGAVPAAPTVAALPIAQGDRSLGLLVLGRCEDRPFSIDDRTFLGVLTGLCALALDRLRLYADRARVRAVLRRQFDQKWSFAQLRVGDMELDLEEQTITIGNRAAILTPCELRMLTFLAEQPGRPRSRREILRQLWHTDHVGDERACDVHVSNLRRKIEDDPSRPKRLVTVRGLGYALAAN